jgi:hypothetical protein
MSTKSIPTETANLRLGTPATLTGIRLALTGIDIGRDADVRVELRIEYGAYETACTLQPGEPLNLHDGMRLTVTSVENVYSEWPLVNVSLERLIPFPDPWSPTTAQMVVEKMWDECFDFSPLDNNLPEFRNQVQLVGDAIRELENPESRDVPGSLVQIIYGTEPAADFILDAYGVPVRVHFPDYTWMTSDVSAIGVDQARAIATALLAHRGAMARS